MTSIVSILNALPWFAWIAIVAIVCGSIDGAVKRSIKHRERMAMIHHGINPDTPTEKTYVYQDAEV
jgi:phosphatidylserine synthase